MSVIVTQIGTEVVLTVDNPQIDITTVPTEVVVLPDSDVRITQPPVEVVILPNLPVRITQPPVEVVVQNLLPPEGEEPEPPEDTSIAIWPFINNWAVQAVDEYYSFLTDIKVFRSGYEQRHRRRLYPRRGFSFNCFAGVDSTHENSALVQSNVMNILRHGYGKEWLVPVFHDVGVLTTDVNIGATTLTLENIPGLDFEEDKKLVIYRKYNDYEVKTIDTISGNIITVIEPLLKAYKNMTKVFPIRSCLLAEDEVTFEAETDFISSFRVDFSVLAEELNVNSKRFSTFSNIGEYEDIDVIDPDKDWNSALTGTVAKRQNILDLESTIFRAFPRAWKKTREGYSFTVRNMNRTEFSTTLTTFCNFYGSWKKFWLPLHNKDLHLIDPGVISNTTLKIKANDATKLYVQNLLPLYLIHKGTTNTFLKVDSIADDIDGNTILTLSAPLAINLNNDKLFIMKLCRFDSDTIEIKWDTDTLCDITLNFKEINDAF